MESLNNKIKETSAILRNVYYPTLPCLGNSSRIYYSVTPPKSLCYVKRFCLPACIPHESKIKRQSFFSTLYFPKLGLVSSAEFGSQCFSSGYHWPLIINALEKRVPFSLVLLLFPLKNICSEAGEDAGMEADPQSPGPRVQGNGQELGAAAGSGLAFDQPVTKRSLGVSAFQKAASKILRIWSTYEWPDPWQCPASWTTLLPLERNSSFSGSPPDPQQPTKSLSRHERFQENQGRMLLAGSKAPDGKRI